RAAFPEQLGEARWFGPFELTCLILAGVVVALGSAWVSRFGLSPEESAQLLFGATTPQSWWEKPRMAALLSRPRGHRVRAPERNTPHDYRRAINELLAEVRFAGAELGAVARRAAERMADAI